MFYCTIGVVLHIAPKQFFPPHFGSQKNYINKRESTLTYWPMYPFPEVTPRMQIKLLIQSQPGTRKFFPDFGRMGLCQNTFAIYWWQGLLGCC